VASPTPSRASLPFDLENLRETPELLAEFERLVARWSVAPPDETPFVWPAAVDAPPELKAFYAIAHTWPGARLYGSQDFLRPLDNLARDGGKLTVITENQGNFRIALESIRGAWMLWACTFGQTRPWMPMDGAHLPDLLVTFGIQELMFGARFLTANNRHVIEDCRVGGGFQPSHEVARLESGSVATRTAVPACINSVTMRLASRSSRMGPDSRRLKRLRPSPLPV